MSTSIESIQAEADRIRAKSFLPLHKITIMDVTTEGVRISLRSSEYLMTPEWTPRKGVKAPYILRDFPAINR